eukprot:3650781-Rhodomonas_salina.1
MGYSKEQYMDACSSVISHVNPWFGVSSVSLPSLLLCFRILLPSLSSPSLCSALSSPEPSHVREKVAFVDMGNHADDPDVEFRLKGKHI